MAIFTSAHSHVLFTERTKETKKKTYFGALSLSLFFAKIL